MTPESRPFRFALLLDTRDATAASVHDLALRAADIGFAILLGTDHVGRWSSPLLLLAAAYASPTLRVGTFVLNNDLRNPVVLAQELATLDLLTEGRLEIGIGAGWMPADYDATGTALDPPARRIRRMKAGVSVIKQALRDGYVQYESSDDYPALRSPLMPMSVQRPHPPFLIGGGGPGVLRYAAREADIVSLNPRFTGDGRMEVGDATSEAIDRKVGWIRDAAGDRWPALELNANLFGINPDRGKPHGPAAGLLAEMTDRQLRESPHFLFGSEEAMVAQLEERRERWGLSYVVVRQADIDGMAPLITRIRQPE